MKINEDVRIQRRLECLCTLSSDGFSTSSKQILLYDCAIIVFCYYEFEPKNLFSHIRSLKSGQSKPDQPDW